MPGVSFRNVPSFVLHAGVPVRLGGPHSFARTSRSAGAFYAIVDSEAAGIPIMPGAARRPAPRRDGRSSARSRRRMTVAHPERAAARRASTARSSPAPRRPGRRPAQRDDLRRRRGGPIALRHRHLRGHGGARRDGPARRRTRRSRTRASSAPRSAAGSSAKRPSASCRRSCPTSRARPSSPGSTRFVIDPADPLRRRASESELFAGSAV